MHKIGNTEDPEQFLETLKEKFKDDKLKAAMVAYVDEDDNMFMFGDSHSISIIVTNLIFTALHERLHDTEKRYEQRQAFGMEGFIPDDPAV